MSAEFEFDLTKPDCSATATASGGPPAGLQLTGLLPAPVSPLEELGQVGDFERRLRRLERRVLELAIAGGLIAAGLFLALVAEVLS